MIKLYCGDTCIIHQPLEIYSKYQKMAEHLNLEFWQATSFEQNKRFKNQIGIITHIVTHLFFENEKVIAVYLPIYHQQILINYYGLFSDNYKQRYKKLKGEKNA